MKTITRNTLNRITWWLLSILLCWTATALAVEAPGSPFTYIAAESDSTVRKYTGTVFAGQNTLVAFERDVYNPSPSCVARDYSVADLSQALTNGTSPLHGTVTFSSAANQTLDATEDDGFGGCAGGSYEAGAIYYQADADYTGSDYVYLGLPNSEDAIHIHISVEEPPDTGAGVGPISPILLRTSIKQTSSMISERIRQVVTPKTLFEDEDPTESDQEDQPTEDETTSLSPASQKRSLSDIMNISVDSKTIGISAGDASMKHGIWTNLAYTSNDNNATETATETNTYILGYDYKFSDRMALGVAITFEKIQADVDFNNGDLDGDGYTVSPYFTMLLTDYLAMDIIAGYAIVNYEQNRNFGAVTSSVDADRQFLEFSINGFHYIDKWSLNGYLSFFYANEKQDSYTESDGTKITANNIGLSQLSIGLEIAYGFKYVEPYLTLAFEYDTQYEDITEASYDKKGGDGGFGLRIFFSDQLSGNMYGSTKFSRDNYNEYSILGNLRYDF